MILSSVLLSIMIRTTILANNMLNMQIAASEFQSAENLAITIESEINNLLYKPGSSKVIKTSFSATAPGYTETGETMNVTIGDLEPYSSDVNILNIEGRQFITGAPDYDLKGDSSLLLLPYKGSLGRIHVSKPHNMRVSLDYERVLCTFTGIVNMTNPDTAVYCPYNIIELTSVILTFGEFDAGDNAIILIQNETVEPEINHLTGNFSITVSTQEGSDSTHLTDLGGNPAFDTQVIFQRVYIKISVLGGG